jgi:hypothetical protein
MRTKWFLTHGCSPNDPTRRDLGQTMITRAASVAPLSIIQLLISVGGIIDGNDAVARAVLAHVSNVPGRLEVAECLLDNGADVDAYAYKYAPNQSIVWLQGRKTGLLVATRGNRKDMMELLLRRGQIGV